MGDDDLYPLVTVSHRCRWVAVQWSDRGMVHVLHDNGTVTERLTVPGDVGEALNLATPLTAVDASAGAA
jgi:hypothetical protein